MAGCNRPQRCYLFSRDCEGCRVQSNGITKRGTKLSEFTLSSQEVLGTVTKDNPYYWRVKAIDGANNQSEWSAPFTFYTSEASKKTNDVFIIVGICVGVGGIAFLIEWLRRR